MHTVIPAPRPATIAVAGIDAVFPVRRIWCIGRNSADHAREGGGPCKAGDRLEGHIDGVGDLVITYAASEAARKVA
jgi:2-keto-4-pentenoate hydratase/2-oxohepta-3-ene-1,7-dioic acid hydratase in catechol pathway